MKWEAIIRDGTKIKSINAKLELIASSINNPDNESILDGKMGAALFYYYFNSLQGNKSQKELADSYINDCLESISKNV